MDLEKEMTRMIKPALTPSGVNQKTDELYALNDNALLAQAALIAVDLVTWIVDSFELTVSQYDYLINLEPTFLESFKEQVGRAVANRWPITFLPGPGTQDIVAANANERWICSKEEGQLISENLKCTYTGYLKIETGIENIEIPE